MLEAYEGKIALETGKSVDNNSGVVFGDVVSTCQIEIFIGWQHWLSLKAGRCQGSAWSLEAMSDGSWVNANVRFSKTKNSCTRNVSCLRNKYCQSRC